MLPFLPRSDSAVAAAGQDYHAIHTQTCVAAAAVELLGSSAEADVDDFHGLHGFHYHYYYECCSLLNGCCFVLLLVEVVEGAYFEHYHGCGIHIRKPLVAIAAAAGFLLPYVEHRTHAAAAQNGDDYDVTA